MSLRSVVSACIVALFISFIALPISAADGRAEEQPNHGGQSDHGGHGDHTPSAIAVSLWTPKGELFMEYPPPVARQPFHFTCHLTELGKYVAVSSGAVFITLTSSTGSSIKSIATKTARLGIFQNFLTIDAPGEYAAELRIEGPELNETFPLPPIRAYASAKDIPHESEEAATPNAVPFLKEQQWKIPFRTVLAEKRPFVDSIRVLGTIKPKAGWSVQVTAPVQGKIVSPLPQLGMKVKEGDTLLSIAPLLAFDIDKPSLEQDIQQTEIELQQAQKELARVADLIPHGVIPAKEGEAAKSKVATAMTRKKAALDRMHMYTSSQNTNGKGGGVGNRFAVPAPISGTITSVDATTDGNVSREKPLVTIENLSRVWVDTRVYEPDLPQVRKANGAVFFCPGMTRQYSLAELNGAIHYIGRHIALESRTASVIFEVDNPQEQLSIGGSVEADIMTEKSADYIAVPNAAVLEDGVRHFLFVQKSGEEFEQRDVEIFLHDREYTAIKTGLNAGERVVTTGAYAMKLSTLSGSIPEHGHAH